MFQKPVDMILFIDVIHRYYFINFALFFSITPLKIVQTN